MKKNQVKKSHIEKITDKKLKNERMQNIVVDLLQKDKIKMSLKGLIRLDNCGSFIQFLADKKLEKYKLYSGIFCKNRFCPICSKNKSKKDAVEIKIMSEYVKKELKRRYLFVTFTAPNVFGTELKDEITRYNKAFNHFIKLKKYKNVIKGYIRKLEVTYNNNKKSKSYSTYHPHFHVLISVSNSYFTDSLSYIRRDEWLKDWQEVMNDKTITQVDVRVAKDTGKNNVDTSILELTKYIAKDSNYLVNEDVFSVFYNSLKGKREYAFGGDFKIAKDKLKNGELEKYYLEDETEWYWLLTHKWKDKKYSEEKEKYEEDKEIILPERAKKEENK